MKLKIKVNPIVNKDIEEIKEYIRGDNINAINNFSNELEKTIENLSEFPELGMKLSKKILLKTDYRYIIVKEYIVFYKYDEEYIFIYRILNSKRDYLKILFD